MPPPHTTATRTPDASPPPATAGTALAAVPCVGIFDSGVGGLSVMAAVRARLPGAPLLYAADTGHAPYGDRSESFVCERSRRIARFLLAEGAQVLVVACNTATAAAVAALRAEWPDVAIIGVEPGIKPALARSASGRVGVLATSGTLASDKFRRLAAAHAGAATLVLQACPGLADAIESPEDEARLETLVQRYAAPLRDAGVDVAVLGCTHYVFARDRFARALPGVHLLDTGEAVARETARRAAGHEPAAPPDAVQGVAGTLSAYSSGDAAVLAGFARRWLGEHLDVKQVPV